jgi:acetyl esterase/lipase
MSRAARAARPGWVALLASSSVAALAWAGCGGPPDVDVGGDQSPLPRVAWGEPADGKPTGVVMLLHGGGWQPSRSGYQTEKAFAPSLQAQGYATVVVGYSEGAEGFHEVQRIYSQARKRYPGLPICAYGLSAGGHLALMLATREPDLTCVVDLAGPADLTSLNEQGGDEASRMAAEAFGEDELARWSPVRYADRIKAKVLMVLAEDDPVNPVEQGQELTQVLPSAELVVVPPGPAPAVWAHRGGVDPEADRTAIERQRSFIASALNGS